MAITLCQLKTYLTPDMVLPKPVVEATSNIVFDPVTYHEPHTFGRARLYHLQDLECRASQPQCLFAI